MRLVHPPRSLTMYGPFEIPHLSALKLIAFGGRILISILCMLYIRLLLQLRDKPMRQRGICWSYSTIQIATGG